MRQLLLSVIFLVGATCDGPPSVLHADDDPSDPLSPRYPESESIREAFVSDAEGRYVPGLDCLPLLSTWGTDDEADDVLAFYRDLGFTGQGGHFDPASGKATPSGGLVRWIAERGQGHRWRKVDVASGFVAGKPEWSTVIQLFAPPRRCIERAS